MHDVAGVRIAELKVSMSYCKFFESSSYSSLAFFSNETAFANKCEFNTKKNKSLFYFSSYNLESVVITQ